ncbi:CCA tRNA nucleotidyltransferase [Candidatus Nesciobacter abundans]|nr:CCA tRNA nucleotidyltransferase [Candidatus Nesciobacter abundans]
MNGKEDISKESDLFENYKIASKSSALWLQEHNLQNLLSALEPAMVVGGAVRNHLLGIQIGDIDIATELTPEEVIKKARENKFQVIPTGLQHGTVTCVKNGFSYEVTTLRVDVKSYGRYADVRFSKSWKEDAERRDLTINALYLDKNGNIFDFVNGLKDIKSRTIKFIGNPAQRIQEDYLRILRFFRFSSFYGEQYDNLSFSECKKQIENLIKISRERCTSELLKILSSNKFLETVKLIDEIRIWDYCDFPKPNLEILNKLNISEKQKNRKTSEICRLSCFYGDFTKMKLSNKQYKNVITLKDLVLENKYNHIRWLHESTDELFWDGIILKSNLNNFDFLEKWRKYPFPLSGKQIMDITKINPGPKLGELIENLKSFYYSQEEPSKDALLEYLSKVYLAYKSWNI